MWSSIRNCFAVFLLLASASAQTVNLDTNVKGSRVPMWGTDSGSANAYVLTTTAPLAPTLRTGSFFSFAAAHANTSSSTLNVDSTGAIAIKKMSSGSLVNLSSGDIAANQIHIFWYDGTQYQCVTCVSGGGGGGSSVSVNGTSVSSPNFNDTTPAAASNNVNVTWQQSSGSVSAQVGAATGTTLGVVKSLTCTNQFFRSLTTGTGAFNCATVDLTADVTGVLPVANGGNGTASPSLTGGTNISLSGSWPNYTISATNGGGGTTGLAGPGYAGGYCAGSSFTCSSRFNVVANKLIIATCAYFTNGAGAGTPGFNDTTGLNLTWHQIATVFQTGQSRGVTTWWANPGSSTGADTFNCTNTVSMSFGGMTVNLIEGATLSSPIDGTVATASGNNVAYDLSVTTSSDNDLLWAVAEYGGGFASFTGNSQSTYIPVFWESAYIDGSAADFVLIRPAKIAGTYYFQGTFSANHAVQVFAVR